MVSEWQLILWWCGIEILAPPPPPPVGNRVKEVLLEIVLSPGSKLGVELDVWCQPCALVELNRLMDSLHNQPVFDGLVEHCDVNDMLLLVI